MRRVAFMTLPWVLLLVLGLGLFARCDEVVLNNGHSIRGEVVREDSKEVVVVLESGEKLKLARGMVKEVIKSVRKPKKPEGTPTPSARPAEEESARATWRYTPGQVLRYRYRVLVDVYDGKVDARMRITHDYELRGKEPTPKGSRVGVTITRTRQSNEINGKIVKSLDSSSKRPEERPDDKGVLGAEMTFHVTPEGEATLLALADHPIGPKNPEEQAEIHQKMVVGVHDFMVKGMLGTFPSEPLSRGKPTWRSSTLGPDGGIKYALEFQLSQITPQKLLIQFEGKATPTQDFTWGKNSNLELTVGRVTGLARLNRSGHLARSGLTIVLHGKDADRRARLTMKLSTDLMK